MTTNKTSLAAAHVLAVGRKQVITEEAERELLAILMKYKRMERELQCIHSELAALNAGKTTYPLNCALNAELTAKAALAFDPLSSPPQP